MVVWIRGRHYVLCGMLICGLKELCVLVVGRGLLRGLPDECAGGEVCRYSVSSERYVLVMRCGMLCWFEDVGVFAVGLEVCLWWDLCA